MSEAHQCPKESKTLSRYVRGSLRPARAAFTEPSVHALLIWDEDAVAFTMPSPLGLYHFHSENEDDLNISHTTDLDETSWSHALLIAEE